MQLRFHRNLGAIDRSIRIILGIALNYVAFFNPSLNGSWISPFLGIFGTIMLVEGVIGY